MPRPSEAMLEDAVYFWNADQPHGQFSQWYPKPFSVKDKTYPTAEHYMMCAKARLFGDCKREEDIRLESSPEKVRDLGRRIKPFSKEIWDENKFDLVCTGNRAKFSDPDLKKLMLATGDRLMIEASPIDRIWGIGFGAEEAKDNYEKWGENLMGKVMMQIRQELQRESRTGTRTPQEESIA